MKQRNAYLHVIKIMWISALMKISLRSRIQGMAALLSQCVRFGIEEWFVVYIQEPNEYP